MIRIGRALLCGAIAAAALGCGGGEGTGDRRAVASDAGTASERQPAARETARDVPDTLRTARDTAARESAAPETAPQDTTPQDPGLALGDSIYQSWCSECHTLYPPQTRPPDQWFQTVQKMQEIARFEGQDTLTREQLFAVTDFLESEAREPAERRE